MPDELYQLESEHAKGAKLRANIILKAKNASKLISMYLKDNLENQTISELYSDDKKKNILASVVTRKSAKGFYKNFYTKRQPQKLPLLNFFIKISNRKKISNEKFPLFETKIYLKL